MIREISEEFRGLLQSLGVTGGRRVNLDDVLRLQGLLADFRHLRPRLTAQVCFQKFLEGSGGAGNFSRISIKAERALGIWPLMYHDNSARTVAIFPGGVIPAYDTGVFSQSATPVGSKGLVSQSRVGRGVVASDPTVPNGVLQLPSTGAGVQDRVFFNRMFGEWVYQPESSEFAPAMIHFANISANQSLNMNVAWLEVRTPE